MAPLPCGLAPFRTSLPSTSGIEGAAPACSAFRNEIAHPSAACGIKNVFYVPLTFVLKSTLVALSYHFC